MTMALKSMEELRRDGYTEKQAKAIIEAQKKKKKTTAVQDIKKSTDEKNKALIDLANW